MKYLEIAIVAAVVVFLLTPPMTIAQYLYSWLMVALIQSGLYFKLRG